MKAKKKYILLFFQVMYVASTIPYLFLLILLVRGMFLPGSVEGLRYFWIPRWSHLMKFSVIYQIRLNWFIYGPLLFYRTSISYFVYADVTSINTLSPIRNIHMNKGIIEKGESNGNQCYSSSVWNIYYNMTCCFGFSNKRV